MARILMYLLELVGVAGIVGLLVFIPWTKMALGAALTFLGAFFPTVRPTQTSGGGEVRWHRVLARFSGGIRVGVVLGGLVLLIGAVLAGVDGKRTADDEKEREVREFMRQLLNKHAQSEHAAEAGQQSTDEHLRRLAQTLAELDQLERNQPAKAGPRK